jgi:hypothetical protein
MFDDLDIPEFLKLTPQARADGWLKNPPRSMPAIGRPMTEAERERKADDHRIGVHAECECRSRKRPGSPRESRTGSKARGSNVRAALDALNGR